MSCSLTAGPSATELYDAAMMLGTAGEQCEDCYSIEVALFALDGITTGMYRSESWLSATLNLITRAMQWLSKPFAESDHHQDL